MERWNQLLLFLLQFSSQIKLTVGNNIFALAEDDETSSAQLLSTANRAMHDLFQTAGGLAVTAQARIPLDQVRVPLDLRLADLNCLHSTISLMDQTLPGGLGAPFETEIALLCLLGNDCDFSVTDFFVRAKVNCEAVSGTLKTGDFYLCSDEFGTTGLGPDANVKMSNVPICVSSVCSQDTTMQMLVQRLHEVAGSENDRKFEKTFTGQCAPIEIEWRVPSIPSAERTAKVGDTVIFNYDGFHNVYIHPSGDCDEAGSILVAGINGGPASYTFTAEHAGSKLTFACDIGTHCESGQIISFQVEGTTAPTMTPTPAPTLLPSQVFKNGMDNGEYDLILDVRTEVEWAEGHIVGATFADSLASFGSSTHTGAKPSDFEGCELCTIAVYCRSGARARIAIQILLNNGFEGQIYNAQGINQWRAAGFPVVSDDSVIPPCTTSEQEVCPGTLTPPSPPSDVPSDAPVLVLPMRKVQRSTSKEGLKVKRTNSGSDLVQANRNGIRGGSIRHLSPYHPQELRSSD